MKIINSSYYEIDLLLLKIIIQIEKEYNVKRN